MTESERKLIIDTIVALNTGFTWQNKERTEAIKQEFLSFFTVDVSKEPNYVLKLLEKAYEEQNPEDVEHSLSIAFLFDLFSEEYTLVLIKLLESDWHFRHEDIVSAFQKLRLPETVNILYTTAQKQFKYLEYDDYYALAVKCIWALRKIGTAEAKEKLEILAQSSNKVIREKALKRLKDTWE